MDFLAVKILVTYNIILGWPGLCALEDVVSVKHLLVKFPMRNGLEQIQGIQDVAWQYYNTKVQT